MPNFQRTFWITCGLESATQDFNAPSVLVVQTTDSHRRRGCGMAEVLGVGNAGAKGAG